MQTSHDATKDAKAWEEQLCPITSHRKGTAPALPTPGPASWIGVLADPGSPKTWREAEKAPNPLPESQRS